MRLPLICAIVFVAALASAADAPKPLTDLISERKALMEELEGYKKENEKNVAAFNKLPAVAEFNAKQQVLRDKWTKAQSKVSQLNGEIADRVMKEKK